MREALTDKIKFLREINSLTPSGRGAARPQPPIWHSGLCLLNQTAAFETKIARLHPLLLCICTFNKDRILLKAHWTFISTCHIEILQTYRHYPLTDKVPQPREV